MKKICVLLFICCFISGCGSKNTDMDAHTEYQTITAEEVFKEMNDHAEFDFYIVDVRTEFEYTKGHIEMAINIPLESLDTIEGYGFNKDAKIIVYCQSGSRSKEAVHQLIEAGYQNVFDLGGIQDWDYDIVQ